MELRKYVAYDGAGIVHFQQPLLEEQVTVYTSVPESMPTGILYYNVLI